MSNHALCQWEDAAFNGQSTHLDIRKPSGASDKIYIATLIRLRLSVSLQDSFQWDKASSASADAHTVPL